MKKVCFVFVMTIIVGVCAFGEGEFEGEGATIQDPNRAISQTTDSNIAQNSQWDFFSNVIPKQKSITISGSSGRNSWTMTIDDKYKVSFSGSYSYSGSTETVTNSWSKREMRIDRNQASATFRGQGVVIWDNENMKINLTTNASGTYEYNGHERYNANSDEIGGRVRMVDQDFDRGASGSTTINSTFDLDAEYANGQFSGKLRLAERTLTLNMSGSGSHTASIRVGGSNWLTANVVKKSESELNASSRDEFGEWNWNSDRSKLFLKSQTSNNNFVIWNVDGEIFWSMEMEKGMKGASESTTETGDKLINLSMAFDGASSQVFSFIENVESSTQNVVQLDYAVYNRFRGTLEKNAKSILEQIKGKRMLILSYTANNAQKTDMFLLEGLDTILDYLDQ